VRYLLLLYGDPAAEAALSPAERRAIVEAHLSFRSRLEAEGALVRGEPLDGGVSPFTVRLRDDGARLVTDGPFVETKEGLGGYYLVECAGREAAEAIAREVPQSPGLVIEAWPVAPM
jgi:hypothetical protein